MFSTQMVPTYFDGMKVRTEAIKGDDYKVWDLTLRIDPITPALAAEIDDDVRGSLFRRNTAEPHPKVKQLLFAIPTKPQAITWHPDPTIAKASFSIDESKIRKIHAKKEKGAESFVLFITVAVTELDGKGLLFLQEALQKCWYLNWSNATAGLFDESEVDERRARSAAAAGAAARAH